MQILLHLWRGMVGARHASPASLGRLSGKNRRRSPRASEKSLPLEGKVVRLKPDRMRSKVAALYQLMVMIGSFDLISQP